MKNLPVHEPKHFTETLRHAVDSTDVAMTNCSLPTCLRVLTLKYVCHRATDQVLDACIMFNMKRVGEKLAVS